MWVRFHCRFSQPQLCFSHSVRENMKLRKVLFFTLRFLFTIRKNKKKIIKTLTLSFFPIWNLLDARIKLVKLIKFLSLLVFRWKILNLFFAFGTWYKYFHLFIVVYIMEKLGRGILCWKISSSTPLKLFGYSSFKTAMNYFFDLNKPSNYFFDWVFSYKN